MTLHQTYSETQFETIEELFDVIEDLPTARQAPLFSVPEQSLDVKTPEDLEHHSDLKRVDGYAIFTGSREEGTLRHHTNVSDSYQLVQHREALQPIAEALRNNDISFKGQVYHPKRSNLGHVRARFQLTDERYQIQSDQFSQGLCIFVDNSFDKSGALKFHAGGFDFHCFNGQMWGDILINESVKHVGDGPAKALRRFETFMNKLDGELEKLLNMLGVAINTEVQVQEITPLVRAVDIPQTYAEKILSGWVDGHLLAEAQQSTRFTVKGVFDATTNFFTHQYDRSIAGAERHLTNASKLVELAQEKEELVAKGKEILERESE